MNAAQTIPDNASIEEMRMALGVPTPYKTWAEYQNARHWGSLDVDERLALIRLSGFTKFASFGISGKEAMAELSKKSWLDVPQNTRTQLIAGSKRAQKLMGMKH